ARPLLHPGWSTTTLDDATAHSALGVAPVVVGHHFCDPGDAEGGEVGSGAGDEPRAGRTLLVVEELGVGQPRVVIDHRMHVVVADLRLLPCRGLADLASVGLPAAALGVLRIFFTST